MIDLESVLRNLLGHGTETVAVSLSIVSSANYSALLIRVPRAPGEFVTYHLKGNTVQPPPQGVQTIGSDHTTFGSIG